MRGALPAILGFLTVIIVTAIIIGHGKQTAEVAGGTINPLAHFVSVADLSGTAARGS